MDKFEQTPGDGEAWCAAVHGVTKSQTGLRDGTTKRHWDTEVSDL